MYIPRPYTRDRYPRVICNQYAGVCMECQKFMKADTGFAIKQGPNDPWRKLCGNCMRENEEYRAEWAVWQQAQEVLRKVLEAKRDKE
uniref:Uncharacterized protein n=1 Tax=viral metagenome TaxID=1070528 RepID=A0A6M3KWL7_9ZZZZ